MAIYVDQEVENAMQLYGRMVPASHLFTDDPDLSALHTMAERLGLQRQWFQSNPRHPHYDLTRGRRNAAVLLGAIEVDEAKAVELLQRRRERLRAPAMEVLYGTPEQTEGLGPRP
ncbi:DUF4031 domain-containing protein [Pseudoxanthomonas sp. LjRoot168]|uniref:DUF4031 domain-containing protein n=1 Tax=unclassified Pseudoxanthomonas TaxID=2645906 RepID=UPI003ECC6C79